MSVMLCTGATFVKKNSFLVAGIVSYDTAGLYLLTSRILEPSCDVWVQYSLSNENKTFCSSRNSIFCT